jgi:hypothetical protein
MLLPKDQLPFIDLLDIPDAQSRPESQMHIAISLKANNAKIVED